MSFDLLRQPHAERYMYRLYNDWNNCPHGELGPSVAFTVWEARDRDVGIIMVRTHWRIAGTLIYAAGSIAEGAFEA